MQRKRDRGSEAAQMPWALLGEDAGPLRVDVTCDAFEFQVGLNRPLNIQRSGTGNAPPPAFSKTSKMPDIYAPFVDGRDAAGHRVWTTATQLYTGERHQPVTTNEEVVGQ